MTEKKSKRSRKKSENACNTSTLVSSKKRKKPTNPLSNKKATSKTSLSTAAN